MTLSNESFDAVTEMFHRVSGIRLTPAKRSLVEGRLLKLARERGLSDINDYVRILLDEGDSDEQTRAVDKLTTNETYFFREPQHFQHLEAWLRGDGRRHQPLKIWSAASSSGEEAYSLAMLLSDVGEGGAWEIVGTDLSTSVLEQARRAVYPLSRATNLPPAYLKRWCLRGRGSNEGMFQIGRELRGRVHFSQVNLMRPLPDLGPFDIIFLRNVLIYFDNAGKADIVKRVLTRLAPHGRLYTGHAESIANLGLPVRSIAPAVYVHA
jgi:chemotaxis protein methyltransferase CheR